MIIHSLSSDWAVPLVEVTSKALASTRHSIYTDPILNTYELAVVKELCSPFSDWFASTN